MANDIIASIQNSLSTLELGLDEDTKAVAGGSISGSKRISIKGGVFRKMAGGKEVASIEDRHMNLVIVKMAHNAARTYYSQSYKEGEKVSPECWSHDSKVPAPEVTEPKAASCDACPFSVKGSGNGGGAACRLSWRIAVVLPNDISGDVMQLVLPATSCFGNEENGKWPFRKYIQMLASNNISAGRVVTRVQFDTKSPVPKLVFSPAAALSKEDIERVQVQAKSTAAENAIKLTVYQSDSSENVAAPSIDTTSNEDVPEPTLRTSKTEESPKEAKVSEVVKKWTKKG